MSNKFILNTCKYIYSIFNIPIFHYIDKVRNESFSYNILDYELLKPTEDILLPFPHHICYFISNTSFYYGKIDIKDSNESLLIGPVTSTIPNNKNINSFLKNINNKDYTLLDLKYYFNTIHVISFENFLEILCFINFLLNEEIMTGEDILNYNKPNYESTISKAYTESSYVAKENNSLHNTYKFEQLYLNLVEQGNIIGIKELLTKSFRLNSGIIAYDNIRQTKNIFIASVTLTTRAAIKGGLEIETAYQLSDTYIQQMEHLDDLKSMNSLQYQMLINFTELVSSAKLSPNISNIVFECIQFISNKTNESITVSDVANHVNRSRSFISRTFKAEMNIDMSAYIMNKKLEEAQGLLKFTDKSISEISNYLCFSSQSYFQNVFKKNFNLTPTEYRKKYAK